MATKSGDEWVFSGRAAQETGITQHEVRRLAREGVISTVQLPGGIPRVNLAELRAVISQSIRPARRGA
jgi:hypothetical protein